MDWQQNLRSDSSCPFCEIVRGENFENYQDAIEDFKAASEGFHSHIIVSLDTISWKQG
jgi:hypothetical protein